MKKLTALVLSSAMILTLAGCGEAAATTEAASSDAAPAAESTEAATETAAASDVLHDRNGDGKLVIYGIYKSGDQTWFLNEGAAAEALVKSAGGEFNYVDVQTDGQKELDAINTAIANNADGIVTCTPDQTMSQNIVDLCTEAGIPVVACDDALEDADGNKLVPWVGISGFSIGQSIGEWVVDYIDQNGLKDDASCGLLMMTMSTTSSCVPRTDGEKAVLDEKMPEIEADGRLFTVDYDGTTEKGNTGAAAIFTANPQITKWIVFGANEEGVVGAVRALETAGLDGDSVCVGMGAYLAKDEYKKGTCMVAAPFFSDVAIGEGSVQAVFDLIDGKDVDLESAVDAIMTTPDNYEEVMGDEAN